MTTKQVQAPDMTGDIDTGPLVQLLHPASPVEPHTGENGYQVRRDNPEALRVVYELRRRQPEFFKDKPNPLGIDVSKPFDSCLPGE